MNSKTETESDDVALLSAIGCFTLNEEDHKTVIVAQGLDFRTSAIRGLKGFVKSGEYLATFYTLPKSPSQAIAPVAISGGFTMQCLMDSTAVKIDSLSQPSDRTPMLSESMIALRSALHRLKNERCSGRLIVSNSQKTRWTFFFYYGRIMFASGGPHPVRQWLALLRRYTNNHQRQQVLRSLKHYSASSSVQCWEYEVLYESLKRELISREQLSAMCQAVVSWSIFDIWQAGDCKTQFIEDATTLPTTVLIDPEQATDACVSEWAAWQKAGILAYRPSLGVEIIQAEQLQRQTPANTYRSMQRMLDGKATLREIAAKFKKDVRPFVRTLAPFVESGALAWREVADLPCPVKTRSATKPAPPQSSQSTATIACIDDSRVSCEYMSLFVKGAGFDYIPITDPQQALETLLEKRPDLVFLDLVMPHTSGYEVCSQLRRQDCFKHTPIIILTGNDGIIDRVRAKMVGATDFLGKPLSAQEFERVTQEHLSK